MEIVIKLLILIGGFLVGMTVTGIFAAARRKGLEDRIDIMRIASGKQDDAIRKKQATIALLEKKVKRLQKFSGRSE